MSYDVEELKDVVALACELCDCAAIVAADGHLAFNDFGALWAVVEKLGPAMAGIKNIPDEISDLSVQECDELIEFVDTELESATGKSRIVIDRSLKAAKACYEVYLAVRDASR